MISKRLEDSEKLTIGTKHTVGGGKEELKLG